MDKGQFGRRDRLVKEKQHDSYREQGKWPEPTLCTTCGALFANGRWKWSEEPPLDPNKVNCPACQRIKDQYPAGTIELRSAFLQGHWQEISNLIRNEEKLEKGEHPLERIMAIEKGEDHALISTTGIHIARRIGEAVCRAYQGELTFTYGDGEKTIRVLWTR